MAIRQVRIVNGQKVLSEPLAAAGVSDETWGKYVEGSVPEDPSSIIADLPVGAYVTDDKQLPARSVPAPYNTEEWITESGEWTAPVTGWYDALILNGGNGAQFYETASVVSLYAGSSGLHTHRLFYFNKGEEIPVVIGAAGLSKTSSTSVNTGGGVTKFNGVFLEDSGDVTPIDVIYIGGANMAPKGAYAIVANASIGYFYGSGASIITGANGENVTITYDSVQGAVRLRYYDPNKENN